MKYCRWKILRSERIGSRIIDAIGSTKNSLSTVEQCEGSDLSKGTFRSSNFYLSDKNFILSIPILQLNAHYLNIKLRIINLIRRQRQIRCTSDLASVNSKWSTEVSRALDTPVKILTRSHCSANGLSLVSNHQNDTASWRITRSYARLCGKGVEVFKYSRTLG